MQLNAMRVPALSNAWDSLGDAYLADGQREYAREASEKSLALVDSDTAETKEQSREHPAERAGPAPAAQEPSAAEVSRRRRALLAKARGAAEASCASSHRLREMPPP